MTGGGGGGSDIFWVCKTLSSIPLGRRFGLLMRKLHKVKVSARLSLSYEYIFGV